MYKSNGAWFAKIKNNIDSDVKKVTRFVGDFKESEEIMDKSVEAWFAKIKNNIDSDVKKVTRFVGDFDFFLKNIISDFEEREKVFNTLTMIYNTPQRTAQIEERLAELEKIMCDLKKLKGIEFQNNLFLRKASDDYGLGDIEKRMLDKIFKHNLELQKHKSIGKVSSLAC